MSQISHRADPSARRSAPGVGWRDWLDRANPRRTAVWAAVVLVLGSAPAFLGTYLTDMDFYSHVADKLLNGGILYKDAIDTKPPAIFLHYALIFRLFGENNLAAVKLVTVGFVGLTAIAVGGIWRELIDARRAAVASLVFVLASVSGWAPDFLSSNTELLANLFIACGVYCLCKDGFTRRRRWLMAGGALVGVAFLYRFQSAAPLAAYVVLLLSERRSVRGIVARLWPIAVGFAMPAALVVAVYAAMGSLHALVDFLRYDYYYVRAGVIYWPALFAQTGVVLVSQAVFLALAVPQAVRIGLRSAALSGARQSDTRAGAGVRPRREADLFLVLWFGCSALTFIAAGRFFAHYFVQAVPVVALLATERLTARQEPFPARDTRLTRTSGTWRRLAPLLIGVQAMAFAVVNGAFLWWTREPANPHADLVRFAQAHTSKRDRVYVWSSRTHVLFDMDRVYATRFLSNDFLVGRMYGTRHRRLSATADSARAASVPELWPVLMQDLESDPPPLIIDDTKERSNFTLDHYPELQAFVHRRYRPCQVIDSFCVYVLAVLK